jgi:nitrogen regulatory protein P-II 1
MVHAQPDTVYGVPGALLRGGKAIVKKIEAVLLPFKLDDVRDVLSQNNVHEFIVTEVNAYEIERATTVRWGGQSLTDLAPRVKLELVVGDPNVTAIAHAILIAARSRLSEDTKVTIVPVEQIVEIDTIEPVPHVQVEPLERTLPA